MIRKTVLGIFAHPDDAEFTCAGTLSLLKKAGWSVHIATLAPGDKGTHLYTREEVSNIRKKEAENAAGMIDASYHCLDFEDVYILYDRLTINKTTALIRQIGPGIVFTHSPEDYMIDHEITSQVAQTACFSAGIKNMEVLEDPIEPVPYLFYGDPIEAKNKLGERIRSSIYVDVTSEMETREEMLACHDSQRTWMQNHHGEDEYILMMKRIARLRGKEMNTEYAEGFRQHMGHGYPQENILCEILGERVFFKGPAASL